MVIVKMFGGLANKMFQYAFYRSLVDRGFEAYLDNYSWKPKWNFEDIELQNVFPNIKMQFADKNIIKKYGGGASLINKIQRNVKLFSKKNYFRQPVFNYIPEIYTLKNVNYFDGLWQSEKYFNNIKGEIKNDFYFKEFDDEKNVALAKELSLEQSVAIHVRKGTDYIRNNTDGTCTMSYYTHAIEYFNRYLPKPKYYVFTDNYEWVKDKFKNIDMKLIDWNPLSGPNSYRDMQLMSLCKHNIIANSTYSWWGAWLNNNPNKIVIGPKKWFNTLDPKWDTSDLLPDDWIKI